MSVDIIAQPSGWADEHRCVECHEQASSFLLTGHARTLHPATDPNLVELISTLNDSRAGEDEHLQINASPDRVEAVHTMDGVSRRTGLHWCFGSGRHARTWVGLLSDSWGATDSLEFRWTWYSHLKAFDVTPGQPQEGVGGYFHGLGVLYDYPKTRRCFGCHATRVREHQGRLDLDSLQPGVHCQRCHGPRQRHIASGAEVPGYSWRDLDHLEAVRRCAECHRSATEQEPEDVRPDNADIARFQPVGLVQSPCFQASPEMTCTTCHDPHRPLDAQDSLGAWQCTQCHDGRSPQRPRCGIERADDCLSCHMPKVQGSHPLRFTDHWIRIRDDRPNER